jgi:hypothetical protein
MATGTIIQIKRTANIAAPTVSDLAEAELAYSQDASSDGAGAILYIESVNANASPSIHKVGGKYYTDIVDGATANNTAGNLVKRDGSGNFSAGTITAALSGNASTATTATNQSGGTVAATTGSFSGQITSSVGGSGISFTNATSNNILWGTGGVAAPTATTRSVGTKLVLYPGVGAGSNVDFGFGIENATLWSSVAATSEQFKWYGGTTLAATLTGTGNLTAVGTISGTNITTGGNTTGNAASATVLQTARTIGGVSFNGSANINLPGVNQAGNQNTSGTAGSISGFNNPTTAPTANTIVYRDGAGDIAAREIVLSSGLSSVTPTVLVSMYPTTNQMVRTTPAAVAASLSGQTMNINGSSTSCSGNAATATNVAWSGITSRPSNIMFYEGFTLNADTMSSNSTGFTYSVGAPYTGPVARFSTGGAYDLWLNAPYGGGGTIAFRTRNGDTNSLNPWRVILCDSNYTSYAPSLTGSGASGTWNINIIGTAGTAVTAQNIAGGSVSATTGSFANNLTVGALQNSSTIFMTDSDEGTRQIHCNSNRVGFLNQGGGWGSYCNDDGSWITDFNLGIGTSWPDGRLDVAGNATLRGDGNNAYLSFVVPFGRGYFAYSVSAGNVWDMYNVQNGPIRFYTNSTERMIINANGEVYIAGTTDRGNFNLQCNGTGVWGAGAYTNGSDARIKENIAPLESGLAVVQKLNPVTYKYKQDWSKDQSTQPGFIAQELLVALEGKDYVDGVVNQKAKYMSVAYQNIIPILTKAIQELNAKVDTLQSELNALKGN